jgi:hypothetical protein
MLVENRHIFVSAAAEFMNWCVDSVYQRQKRVWSCYTLQDNGLNRCLNLQTQVILKHSAVDNDCIIIFLKNYLFQPLCLYYIIVYFPNSDCFQGWTDGGLYEKTSS